MRRCKVEGLNSSSSCEDENGVLVWTERGTRVAARRMTRIDEQNELQKADDESITNCFVQGQPVSRCPHLSSSETECNQRVETVGSFVNRPHAVIWHIKVSGTAMRAFR